MDVCDVMGAAAHEAGAGGRGRVIPRVGIALAPRL